MQTKTIAIVLIAIGIIMIAYTGFNFVTTETIVDIGPLEINQDKNHFVQWSPVIGVLLLVGGIVAFALNKKVRI